MNIPVLQGLSELYKGTPIPEHTTHYPDPCKIFCTVFCSLSTIIFTKFGIQLQSSVRSSVDLQIVYGGIRKH